MLCIVIKNIPFWLLPLEGEIYQSLSAILSDELKYRF
jgi:hypothetical protein